MAGTVTQTLTQEKSSGLPGGERPYFLRLKFACVADAAAATIPDTNTTAAITAQIKGHYLAKMIIVPGTGTAPTANCDVYIKDEFTIDLLGGRGVDELDAAGNVEVVPVTDALGGAQPVIGTLTLDVDNNAVNSATWDIYLIFTPHPIAAAGLT